MIELVVIFLEPSKLILDNWDGATYTSLAGNV